MQLSREASVRDLLTQKKCEISHLGGGQDKIGSFSHFFIFFLSCPKSCKSAKKIFFCIGVKFHTFIFSSENFPK